MILHPGVMDGTKFLDFGREAPEPGMPMRTNAAIAPIVAIPPY
jgi:hypothetical protein